MITAQTGPVPDHLRDGRRVLIFARWGWESLTQLEQEPDWRVAQFDRALSRDWETFLDVPGWRAESTNPYKDYAPADVIAWAEVPVIPLHPHSAQSDTP